MKTVQVAYLESVESRDWMRKHLKSQEQSRFIREAVAKKIAGLEKPKASRKKK